MRPARRTILPTLLAVSALAGCTAKGCSPSEECRLYRAICQLGVCIAEDPSGWARCQQLSEDCGVDRCLTRSECIEGFIDRCRQAMVPGAPGHAQYTRCSQLECGRASPDAPAPSADAAQPADALEASDAQASGPDAPPPCAGVWCGGACCTAFPCFRGETCWCTPSPTACKATDAGGDSVPPFLPSCCSDGVCVAQGRRCCFLPPSASAPARTQCRTTCASETRHCAFAPYLQADQMSSCLPPPYDRLDAECPF